jgi:hypothetical protein
MGLKIKTSDTINPAVREMSNQKALTKAMKSSTAKVGRVGVK